MLKSAIHTPSCLLECSIIWMVNHSYENNLFPGNSTWSTISSKTWNFKKHDTYLHVTWFTVDYLTFYTSTMIYSKCFIILLNANNYPHKSITIVTHTHTFPIIWIYCKYESFSWALVTHRTYDVGNNTISIGMSWIRTHNLKVYRTVLYSLWHQNGLL